MSPGRRGGRRQADSPYITAVEVFLFRELEVGVEWLLLRLPSGVWQPVAGKIGPREDPIQAAAREALEETGIADVAPRPAHYIDAFIDPDRGRSFMLPVFYARVDPEAAVQISEEHTEFAWLPFEKALERLPYHGYREALKASDAARLAEAVTGIPPGVRRAPEVADRPPPASGRRRRRRRRGRRRGHGGEPPPG
ncbi:MAG TPA: NUDIX domain-containing protein [Candidatus Thermoplasmatota archaeon]|nr:NUDIX domain-containing protein [Candidatus Thermoplasmatota archaeon]